MQKQSINKDVIHLIGLTTRTKNQDEINPQTSKIGSLIQQFWTDNITALIPNKKNPQQVFSVYTDYESDEHGEYTYFYGQEVTSFDNTPANLQRLTIPAAQYQKFTTTPGKMPQVVIDAWMKIWQMTAADLGGKRTYIADFEIYDERATSPEKTVVDIYIGIT